MKLILALFFTVLQSYSLSASNNKDSIDFTYHLSSIKNDNFTSIKSIPDFICNYLNEYTNEKFKFYKRKKNVSDGLFRGGNTELLKGNKYILIKYEHGGIGTHSHLLIFEYNFETIINFWNLRVLFDSNTKDILQNNNFEIIGLKDL